MMYVYDKAQGALHSHPAQSGQTVRLPVADYWIDEDVHS